VSARARRLTARVHVGGRVEIVVPVGVNAHTVRDFVQRFTPWIDRKVAAMQCFAAPSEPVPANIEFRLYGREICGGMAQGAATEARAKRPADRAASRG
jgi:predicted metal-dependent hydrolase